MLTLLLAAMLGLAGVSIWLDRSLQRTAVFTDYPGRPAPGQGITWLLVGSDNRDGLSAQQQSELRTGGDVGAGRTDTMMVVHVPELGADVPTALVSIPRDSYVPIPGHGSDKINAAFSIGGPQLLVQTVEQATNVRVDHYAEIGFAGFQEVVDALGGVSMCPPEPMDDPLAGISLPAGCQQLDGRSALGYVRSRATPRADLDRMVRQREFMAAVVARAASPTVWLNPLNWPPLHRSLTGAVTVDAGARLWDVLRLAVALRNSPVTATVPIGTLTSNSSGDIVLWDSEAAARLFAALRTDSPLPSDSVESPP